MKRPIILIALVVLVMILAGSATSAVPDTSPIYSDICSNETTTNQTEEECPGGCHNWYYYDWNAW